MKNPERTDDIDLLAMVKLVVNLSGNLKVVHEENSSVIEIRPSNIDKVINHDDILAIVELVKKHEKKFLMYIMADSEPIVIIQRKNVIR